VGLTVQTANSSGSERMPMAAGQLDRLRRRIRETGAADLIQLLPLSVTPWRWRRPTR